jgi:hypothetical protein
MRIVGVRAIVVSRDVVDTRSYPAFRTAAVKNSVALCDFRWPASARE